MFYDMPLLKILNVSERPRTGVVPRSLRFIFARALYLRRLFQKAYGRGVSEPPRMGVVLNGASFVHKARLFPTYKEVVGKNQWIGQYYTKKYHGCALELSVKVININYDKDSRILKNCKPLEQYSLFVDTVRRHIVVDREYGFEKAIKECIENDILKEYLQRKSKEVLNMLIGEYDYDTDIAVQREESFELGLVEGSRQKALETARLMKQANCEMVFIEKMTGLSQEEVETLT